jgi:hypothetical protein
VPPGWGTATGPRRIWASSVAPCGSGVGGGFPNVRLQLLDGGRSQQRNPEQDPGRRLPFWPPSSSAPFSEAPAQPSGGGIDPGRWRPFRPPSSGAPSVDPRRRQSLEPRNISPVRTASELLSSSIAGTVAFGPAFAG